ncbi:MAG: hypothetical protein NXI16_13045 [Alphaproteobacteria bacterium]|nr:hypothetical protein [Alphaproteobacteria bacterium]
MAKRRYVIFCDESSKKGALFSNFYGGVLLKAEDRELIEHLLKEKKEELNFFKELKWTKITEQYEEKYIEFIQFYFSFIRTNRLRVRIMFTQNIHTKPTLTEEQIENQYFLLYYQMIKHAFGIRYANPNSLDKVYFSVLLDEVPHSTKKLNEFRRYISNIENTSLLYGKNISIPKSEIANINSKSHNILQGLDIILGSMYFRLNKLNLEKPNGQRVRGKRTRAKERVYKAINKEIQKIYPRFNIGATTGHDGDYSNRWRHPYRHWLFKAKTSTEDES